jgi:hypothetical protein
VGWAMIVRSRRASPSRMCVQHARGQVAQLVRASD